MGILPGVPTRSTHLSTAIREVHELTRAAKLPTKVDGHVPPSTTDARAAPEELRRPPPEVRVVRLSVITKEPMPLARLTGALDGAHPRLRVGATSKAPSGPAPKVDPTLQATIVGIAVHTALDAGVAPSPRPLVVAAITATTRPRRRRGSAIAARAEERLRNPTYQGDEASAIPGGRAKVGPLMEEPVGAPNANAVGPASVEALGAGAADVGPKAMGTKPIAATRATNGSVANAGLVEVERAELLTSRPSQRAQPPPLLRFPARLDGRERARAPILPVTALIMAPCRAVAVGLGQVVPPLGGAEGLLPT